MINIFRSILFLSILILAVHSISYIASTNVVELHTKNFEKIVLKSEEVWIVAFFTPYCEYCRNRAAEFLSVASALKGVIKVGVINGDDNRELEEQYGITEYPVIKIFGFNKTEPQEYNGTHSVDALIDAAIAAAIAKIKANQARDLDSKEAVNKTDIELTDKNFDQLVLQSDDMWLIIFISPKCSQCKSLAPQWMKAAEELKNKVKLATLDIITNKEIASKYNITKPPTIKVFPPGNKTSKSNFNYDGGRTSEEIISWTLNKLYQLTPTPKANQMTHASIFKEVCDQKTLCILAILPHIFDCQSNCRNNYLDSFTKIGELFKIHKWGWLWFEAGAQLELEEALNLGGSGYPALVAVNVKKMIYSPLRGSFTIDGISTFLNDISEGRSATESIKCANFPKIVNTEPWDGKNGEVLLEEFLELPDVIPEKDEL